MYYFYILKSEDFFKYGITSGDPSIRIKRHCRTYKIDLSESYVVELAKDNYRVLENNIKRSLKEFKYNDGLKPDGHSERIKIEKFEEFVNIVSVVLGLHGIKMQKVTKPKSIESIQSKEFHIIRKLKRVQERAFERLKYFLEIRRVYLDEYSEDYYIYAGNEGFKYDEFSLTDRKFKNNMINALYFKKYDVEIPRLYLNVSRFEHIEESKEIKDVIAEHKCKIINFLEENDDRVLYKPLEAIQLENLS